jgi:excisionase family DNA binding protein
MENLETISPQQAAARLGLSHNTIRAWCESGKLPSKRLPSGRLRILASDLVQFYQSLPSGAKNFQNSHNLSD